MLLAWLKGQMGHAHMRTHARTHRSASCCWAGLKGRWVHCVIMAAGLQLVGGGHVDIERTLAGSGAQRRTVNVVYYVEAFVLSVYSFPWPLSRSLSLSGCLPPKIICKSFKCHLNDLELSVFEHGRFCEFFS